MLAMLRDRFMQSGTYQPRSYIKILSRFDNIFPPKKNTQKMFSFQQKIFFKNKKIKSSAFWRSV